MLLITMRNGDNPPEAFGPEVDGSVSIDKPALASILADLRDLAQDNGRLRAERDAANAERDRLAGWIETDRELTNRILTALETELRALRADLERVEQQQTVLIEHVPLPENDPGPSLRTGIGRRFRDRMSDQG